MAYKVVQIQNRVISLPNGDPAQGFWITVKDDATGDMFNIESPSVDPAVVQPLILDHLNKRRGLANLEFQ
jgi:hypothetical protein